MINENEIVEIWTDGACSGNPGPGGWGALLRKSNVEKEVYGGIPDTTNNRMELMAAIKGLEALKRASVVKLYTDSVYVKNGISEWIHGWLKKNWKTANGQPVKNQDLWESLYKLTCTHQVTWIWIKGHSGHAENDRVDKLARQGINDLSH